MILPCMGVDVNSMNMSNHIEFDAPQTSDIAETMATSMLEGIPLTWCWTYNDLPSLHELMQRSVESFDPQCRGEETSPNED